MCGAKNEDKKKKKFDKNSQFLFSLKLPKPAPDGLSKPGKKMYRDDKGFKKYATEYDPIKIGSIDGTDTEPHDRALVRAINSEYLVNKQVKGDPYNTIFIGRLNPRTTLEVVEAEFSKFGKIVHCRLVKDIVTGKSKRYAFVSYVDAGSVDVAVRAMHGQPLERAELVVELEAERRLRGWRPRRLGGGLGGKKDSGQLRFGCMDRPFKKPINIQKDNGNTTMT